MTVGKHTGDYVVHSNLLADNMHTIAQGNGVNVSALCHHARRSVDEPNVTVPNDVCVGVPDGCVCV